MEDFLKWHPNFETGNGKIDEYHQFTFRLANQLHAAKKAHDHAAACNIIAAYLKHLKEHCAYEEGLLRNAHRLDELAQLSQAHRALIETAEAAYRQVAAGRLSIERFFYDVIIISDITNHQLEEDRAFFHTQPDKPI